MADYENLLDSIDAVIKSNNRREITGQILQNTLHQMVGSLGENYQLAGFATPTLDPNSPDQNVFYITDEAGVYTNFDNITLGAGLSFLMWKNEEWTSKTLDIVTADWVDEHYVSKAFLHKVFQFFDEDGVEIFPNDTESVVDNIKAMCGLWTNEYLSALGLGEGSTIPTTLAALNDVTITNPQDGQALVYDAASLHWVNATIQSGVDMSVVWAALAGATNEQINISHLTTALNDYVTATSLATTLQSYVTTSALATELANYASQNWVETNYVSKAFFNSLFEAQDVNGNAITPNNSGQTTIDRLKILVGAYTEQYLSALGLSSSGGGGGSSTLAGLNDVTITNPQDGQALIYDAQSSHWVNGAAISMSAVWTALAAATSEQINSSHLTSALGGYVTTSALASELANYVTTSSLATTLADYVTTSALATTLADYGSKTWIDNNYVSKAFFNRLFRAFAPVAEGESEAVQVEPNDVTTEIDNIKAMFGLWTEQYLSALGLSAGGGGGYTLNEPLSSINNAALGTPSQANVAIVWNGTAWVYGQTGGGSTAWADITGKPTTIAGYGITDAYISNGTITLGANSITPLTSHQSLSGCVKYAGNQTSIGSESPISGAQAWVTSANLPNGNALVYNSSGYEYSMLFSFSPSNLDYGTILRWGYKDKYLYITRRQSGGWLDGSTDWAKISAGYADSAGSVAWSNVSGRPTNVSSFTNDSGYITSSALSSYLPLSAGSSHPLTGDLYLNAYSRIAMVQNTSPQHNFSALTTAMSYALFMEQPDNDEAAFILNGDTAIIWNAFDTGWGFQVHDEDLANGQSNVFNDDSRAFGVDASYRAWARGGFAKYGSDDNYVLLGGGGHAAISGLSVSYASSAGSATSATNATNATYATYDSGGNTIASQTWVGNNYLPLTGGTLSNTLNLTHDTIELSFRHSNSNYNSKIQYCTYGQEAIVWANKNSVTSFLFYTGLDMSATNAWYSFGTPALQIKQNCVSINHLVGNDATPDANLYVGGSVYTTSTITSAGRIQANGAPIYGYMYSASNNAAAFALDKPGSYNSGIGSHAQSDTIWFGACYGSDGTWVDSYTQIWKFNGDIVANGGVTALSDERHKDIVGTPSLSVEQIANTRLVLFRWKDGREDRDIHVGSIAQDWQKILPQSVTISNDNEQTLSLQYGVAALISSITIARKVVNHEQRITELEKECERLRFENEQLRLKTA